ncbi:TRAP transporter TatT component family protein [Treponema primitia]|uniref:TRAP transporter TatT component family protein n=1 Tax=Treponema primitia TaxID=88058 RepID=UPI00397FB00E
MATKAVANALTGEGSSTVFTGDTDPELIAGALPFAIKMYEALLATQPDHQGLILTTGSLFVMYANAFIQGPAEMLPPEEYLERADRIERARKLYLRGAEILATGLEKKYRGWNDAYGKGVQLSYLAKLKKADVPLIYWHAAGILSAYALNPFDLDLGMRLPELTAAIARAYELDPDFNSGALDDFYVLFYSSVPEGMGGDPSKVETHYQRALEKSKEGLAGPYVSYAQAVCVPAQNIETFKSSLESALAVDIEKDPASRLVNIIAQRKARYLLNAAPDFFAELDADTWGEW